MDKNSIQKCLLSYGFYPMTLILKELEAQDRFEECKEILDAMQDYRQRFSIVEDDIPTKWSEEFEKEYFSYFKNLDEHEELLIKSCLSYYIKDIKGRLNLY